MIAPPTLAPKVLAEKFANFSGVTEALSVGVLPANPWFLVREYTEASVLLVPLLVTAFIPPPANPPIVTS